MREKKGKRGKERLLNLHRLIFNELDMLYVFAHARKNHEENADRKDKRGGMFYEKTTDRYIYFSTEN